MVAICIKLKILYDVNFYYDISHDLIGEKRNMDFFFRPVTSFLNDDSL